jgi:hypothetical protein
MKSLGVCMLMVFVASASGCASDIGDPTATRRNVVVYQLISVNGLPLPQRIAFGRDSVSPFQFLVSKAEIGLNDSLAKAATFTFSYSIQQIRGATLTPFPQSEAGNYSVRHDTLFLAYSDGTKDFGILSDTVVQVRDLPATVVVGVHLSFSSLSPNGERLQYHFRRCNSSPFALSIPLASVDPPCQVSGLPIIPPLKP